MISGSTAVVNGQPDLIYPSGGVGQSSSAITFNTYLAGEYNTLSKELDADSAFGGCSGTTSMTNSPLLLNKKSQQQQQMSKQLLSHHQLLLQRASSQPIPCSPSSPQPLPPPYASSLRVGLSGANSHLRSSGQHTAQPPMHLYANSVHSTPSRTASVFACRGPGVIQQILNRDTNPEFFAHVQKGKPQQQQQSCDSGLANEVLYARPPSEHFYFKISDGKTEFI